MAGSGDSVFWWTEERGSWWENHKLRVVMRDFGCSGDQQVTAVSEDGRFHRRVGEQEWESEQVSETGLHSMLRKDGTTYIAGESGALFTRSDGETRQVSKLFGPLNDDSPEDIELQRVTDIWVSPDGTDAVLLDQERLYRKTQEDWEHVPVGSPAQPSQGVEQIWGLNSPQLMTRSGAVYRWKGAVWEAKAENFLSPKQPVVDIDGHSTSKMWVAESRGLAHYDGQSWADLATPASTLQSELRARDADISDIDAAADGTLLLAVGGDVLRLSGSAEEVQLEKIADSPCGAVERDFQTGEGTLLLGTESGCLAWRTDGSWQTQDISPRRVREFEPHPSGPSPLVVTQTGLLKRQEDGSFAEAFRGATVAASAVPGLNAVVLAHRNGLLIRHD
jgi:hypothetical protein